jgi:uncharacterized protein (DUF1330 family)
MQERLSGGLTRRRLLLSGGGGVAGTLFLPELSAFAHAGRAVAELTESPTKKVEARDMAAYVIGLGRSAPRGTEWAKEYLPKAGALVAKHGGKALIGGNSTPRLLALEGKPPLAVVILEFPSLELAQAWHDDPDYAPLKQLRQANVDMEVFVVERVWVRRFHGALHYTKRVLAGEVAMLEFETTVDSKYVNGVDIIRCDDTGRIVEFRVMTRPRQAINAVHEQMPAMLVSMQP